MLGFDRVGLQIISYFGEVITGLKTMSHISKSVLLIT